MLVFRRGLQLEAENDRLRIKDIESQHKMAVLARLAGKSEAEVGFLMPLRPCPCALAHCPLPNAHHVLPKVLLLVNKAPKQSVRSEQGSEKMAKFRERSRLREKRSSQTMELEVRKVFLFDWPVYFPWIYYCISHVLIISFIFGSKFYLSLREN